MSWLNRLRIAASLFQQMSSKRHKIAGWLAKEAEIDRLIADEPKLNRWTAIEAKIDRWIADEAKIDRWRVNESDLDWPMANLEKLRSWIAHGSLIDAWLADKTLITAALHEDQKKKMLPAFQDELRTFRALSATSDRGLSADDKDLLPCLNDRTAETAFDRHYIYHPAWAARVLARTRPARHVDISSILGFSTVVSAFVPVDFYDVRPASLELGDLRVGTADLLQLPFDDNAVPSLSCMHVIEHIGLGRYGDPLDPDGDIKAIRELVRVLSPGGDLLIATPVGRRRVCFNAHRVYDHRDFADLFVGLDLVEFALIPDGAASNGLLYDPPEELVRAQEYGCGCFWFKKPQPINATQ